MDIGPGDALECIKNGPFGQTRAGSIYYVDTILDDSNICGCCLQIHRKMRLTPVAYKSATGHSCPSRFRPYHGPEVEAEQFKRRKLTPLDIINMAYQNLRMQPK